MTSQRERARLPWRTAVLVMAAMGVSILTSVYIARAQPGQAAAGDLAFAGTLRKDGQPMAGEQQLAFTFTRTDGKACLSPELPVMVDERGAFVTSIPAVSCPAGFFDGSGVTVDIAVNGAAKVASGGVSPVPYAKYADQVGYPECPVGYLKAEDPLYTVCRKGPPGEEDEIVRVGSGASSFWVDRYEAILIKSDTGDEVLDPSNFPAFPRNGKWLGTKPPALAQSRRGVQPTVNITWFQANEACRAGGKRLPFHDEWLAAARGTPDPGASDGDGVGKCNTLSQGARLTGINNPISNVSCVSGWGAEDLIGNVTEWSVSWYAGTGSFEPELQNQKPWPDGGVPGDLEGYSDDGTWNVKSGVLSMPNSPSVSGGPSAALVGGNWEIQAKGGGTFSLNLNQSPSYLNYDLGFRCVLPR